MEIFKKHNVRFIAMDFNFDPNNIYGDLIFKIMSAVYEMERKIMIERLTNSRKEKTGRGLFAGGNIPFGYEGITAVTTSRGIERKKIIEIKPHPDNSETVNFMFMEYLQAGSMGAVARALNAKGIKTPKGQNWRVNSVDRILTNPVYIGKQFTKYGLTESAFPVILEKSLFDKVQRLIERHRTERNNSIKPRGDDYILSSVIRCHKCNGKMSGHKYSGRKYYRCRGCGFEVRADRLESVLIGVLNETLKREELFKGAIIEAKEKDSHAINELKREKAQHEKQMRKNELEKSELVKALCKADNPETIRAINEAIKKLSLSGDSFDREISSIINSEIQDIDYTGHVEMTLKKVKDFEGIQSLENSQKKELVRETLKKVIVDRGKLVLTLNTGDSFIRPHIPPRVPVA